MRDKSLRLPAPAMIRTHVLRALRRYWLADAAPVDRLPVARLDPAAPIRCPLRLASVRLPDWASSCTIDGHLLIPQEALPERPMPNRAPSWQAADWFLAAFLLMEGAGVGVTLKKR